MELPPPPDIDKTLTIEGEAADSKAVGDKITSIGNQLTTVNNNINSQGTRLSQVEGNITSHTNSISNLNTKLNSMENEVIIKKTLAISTTSQLICSGTDLEDGVYLVYFTFDNSPCISLWHERFAGIMVWYNSGTNDTTGTMIPLHNSGHAANGQTLYLKTVRTVRSDGKLRLEIWGSSSESQTHVFEFHFKKLMSYNFTF